MISAKDYFYAIDAHRFPDLGHLSRFHLQIKKQSDFMNQQNVFGFLNTFGGGALQNFSIFAMGIMPYITASIIMQLLQMDVVPKFAEWRKQGETGRKKLAQFTRY